MLINLIVFLLVWPCEGKKQVLRFGEVTRTQNEWHAETSSVTAWEQAACLKPFQCLGHFSAGIIDDRARRNNCAIVSNTLKEDVRVAGAANEFQEAGVRRAITFPSPSPPPFPLRALGDYSLISMEGAFCEKEIFYQKTAISRRSRCRKLEGK